MSLNESILKDAALESFGVLVYAAGQEPLLASGEPAAEGIRSATWCWWAGCASASAGSIRPFRCEPFPPCTACCC